MYLAYGSRLARQNAHLLQTVEGRSRRVPAADERGDDDPTDLLADRLHSVQAGGMRPVDVTRPANIISAARDGFSADTCYRLLTIARMSRIITTRFRVKYLYIMIYICNQEK